jgi:hypothetical protein
MSAVRKSGLNADDAFWAVYDPSRRLPARLRCIAAKALESIANNGNAAFPNGPNCRADPQAYHLGRSA